MATDAAQPVKSASRALDVLEHVARADSPPTFAEISARLLIPKSSLFHLLNTLVDRGYLEQAAGARNAGYRLGTQIDLLGRSLWRNRDYVERAVPVLEHLTNLLDETSGYYEARDGFAECLATQTSSQNLLYRMRIGEKVHLHANASGKAILAGMPDTDLDQYIQNTNFHRYTDRTIDSAVKLKRELSEIRKRGVSISRGEYLPGVYAMGIALRDAGRVVGAISVALPEGRWNSSREKTLSDALHTAAARYENYPRGLDL